MQILRKKIKHIYLRINKDGELMITAPVRATDDQIQKIVELRQDWIIKAKLRYQKHKEAQKQRPPIVRVGDLTNAREVLTHRISELSKQHKLPFNKLSFRTQKTRWGSCSSQKNISLNYELINFPGQFIDYVLLHELAHTRYMNHSKNFWDFLESICPGAKVLHTQRSRFCLQ